MTKINLRSSQVETNFESQHDPNLVDFVLPDKFCAIAADINSSDTVSFVKIKENCEAENSIKDDYSSNYCRSRIYKRSIFRKIGYNK